MLRGDSLGSTVAQDSYSYFSSGVSTTAVGKLTNVALIAPITRKRTIAAMTTDIVYPRDRSGGDFISTGRPRYRRYKVYRPARNARNPNAGNRWKIPPTQEAVAPYAATFNACIWLPVPPNVGASALIINANTYTAAKPSA